MKLFGFTIRSNKEDIHLLKKVQQRDALLQQLYESYGLYEGLEKFCASQELHIEDLETIIKNYREKLKEEKQVNEYLTLNYNANLETITGGTCGLVHRVKSELLEEESRESNSGEQESQE